MMYTPGVTAAALFLRLVGRGDFDGDRMMWLEEAGEKEKHGRK
jgi:hypothetical protein